MKLHFYGADKEVTGSCHCLTVNEKSMLVDCGLQQGGNPDNRTLPFSAQSIKSIVITHAHIDHSGKLPYLVKNGYRGPIYATRATCDLLRIMLLDSAHIQESEASWRRRKERRAGMEEDQPLYTAEDAQQTLQLLVPCEYGQPFSPLTGVTVELIDAGHLLGSASAKCTVSENGLTRVIVFSGDIGNKNQPIIRDPQYIRKADYVVMESTYGDRLHGENKYRLSDLARVIEETLLRGGNVVIPSFAIGRTQELLYHIRAIKEAHMVSAIPDFPVYVDSPLALEATQIYDGDLTGYADAQTVALLQKGFRPIRFDRLFMCQTTEESIALNEDPQPKVIISSSGMCDAGRVRHHLKHNLWRKECTVLFVGYQANGTLGRMLVDGVKKVKLFGEEIAVKAQLINFRGFSAHADQNGLLEWISAFSSPLRKVFIVHGEQTAAETFSDLLKETGRLVWVPNFRAAYDLAADTILEEGIAPAPLLLQKQLHRKASPVYRRLLETGERMMAVIRANSGSTNKDLARFTDQLKAILDKWE